MTSMKNTPETGVRHLHPVIAGGNLKRSLPFQRRFTSPGENPFSTVQWEIRNVHAGSFQQDGVEVPKSWSDQSIGIVAKLYFATINGVRESSVRVMIERVVGKITLEMGQHGYFGHEDDVSAFSDELSFALLHQYVTFNSPVWFNVGVPGRKQTCSACFLLSAKDTMVGPDSITDWWTKESIIFKMGAGSGINLSNIRASNEPLSTGGVASGPVAYMRPADAGAGTLKSGGAHRRAAKLVRLDVDHPDIRDFIQAKLREDERMRALMEAGFNLDPSTPEGERNIAECTSFQNANISVGVSDDFMRRATSLKNEIAAQNWSFRSRVSGEVVGYANASELLREIAEAAHSCADPGIQFDDTINAWHTTPAQGRITTSNPCGETYLNDDSACNLASLNVLKYIGVDGYFDVNSFQHHIDLLITAMDATCSFSELPTPAIETNTRELRQLGLGISNLGAAIMAKGLPYDSVEGRDFAASICALMTGRAYARSSQIAEHLGAFARYHENNEAMMTVIGKHIAQLPAADIRENDKTIWNHAHEAWREARIQGAEHGFRNSQVTLIQPGGTTSFMMGCDTTGVEPAFSLVTHKSLAGGGSITLVNSVVERALFKLGYDDTVVIKINEALSQGRGVLEFLREEHAAVFATAVGDNAIEPMGHVRMVAAVQPFLSQGVSKTVNMPNDCTVDDVVEIYTAAWKMGIKGISIYRDGSKATQVLRTKAKEPEVEKESEYTQWLKAVQAIQGDNEKIDSRRRMPRERDAKVIKFSIDGHEGYLTCGMHPDGTLGEIFLNGIGKDGSTLRGICDAFATNFSIGLQYGVPLETLVRKHAHVTFPPSGMTGDPDVPTATSIVDYIARKLCALFLDTDVCEELGVMTQEVKARKVAALDGGMPAFAPNRTSLVTSEHVEIVSFSAPDLGHACRQCGGMMQRTGTCYTCQSCGASTGCG